ncbi:MAG: Fe-S cluster assembly ATPase SufC [Chloroflexi bacterium]|nr:Fe-S cluster assembly ATPase SufC [Chloroflexota bacterium]
MAETLAIRNLHARIAEREILKGVNLTLRKGEVHALMGPNGAGKSTLAYVLMGHPAYEVTEGEVIFKGQNILDLAPEERAHLGLFLAFQYPVAVPGVTLANFLRAAINAKRKAQNPDDPGISLIDFQRLLLDKMRLLGLNPEFAGRYLNDGFSGGEKKRAEVLQMALLEPEFAILDETDSGLDIDALRIVAQGINALRGSERGFLIITHYKRILDYIRSDVVHVLVDGRIVESGGPELADRLEAEGYRRWLEPVA